MSSQLITSDYRKHKKVRSDVGLRVLACAMGCSDKPD